MKIKEKEMNISQTYRAALIATHTIDQGLPLATGGPAAGRRGVLAGGKATTNCRCGIDCGRPLQG